MEKDNTKRGRQLLVALVLVPAIFLLVGGIVVMNYAMDRPLLSVPFLETGSKSEPEESVKTNVNVTGVDPDAANRLKVANAEIEKLRSDNAELTNEVKARQEEVSKLIQERDRLVAELATASAAEEETSDVSRVYEEMSAKQAAAIMNELESPQVANLLKDLSPKQQADILGRMDAQQAAVVTQLLQ
ncbi:MotE family protein [Exiguobacterium chiriqhucha]|uniref:MotE family protein n=1 Tax=Exiguobacterium chiriqhucha TaxID=1385984 RepID=UPI0038B73C67